MSAVNIQMRPVVINKWKKNNETGILRSALVLYISCRYIHSNTHPWMVNP